MNSLVISRFRPDVLDGGAAMRNAQNIYGLSLLGNVDVLTIGPKCEETTAPYVRNWIKFESKQSGSLSIFDKIKQNYKIFFKNHYPAFANYFQESVVAWINSQSENKAKYDVVVVEEIALAKYFPYLSSIATRVIYDAHNVEGLLRKDIATQKKEKKPSFFARVKEKRVFKNLMNIEKSATQWCTDTWVCSDVDATLMREIYSPSCTISVIHNSINTDFYDSFNRVDEGEDWVQHGLNIAYLGSYSYAPNCDAVIELIEDILPKLRRKTKNVKLYLIGREPSAKMQTAARGHDDIIITGDVKEIKKYFELPLIMVLPIRTGSGTRLKIVESFAARRPIVCTHKAAEGINAKNDQELLVAESANEIADSTIKVWEDTKLRARLCSAGYNLVLNHNSWKSTSQAIRNCLR